MAERPIYETEIEAMNDDQLARLLKRYKQELEGAQERYSFALAEQEKRNDR